MTGMQKHDVLAASNGKNARVYVQRRGMWNTHRYMNLEGNRDILAFRRQKYTCFHRVRAREGWWNGPLSCSRPPVRLLRTPLRGSLWDRIPQMTGAQQTGNGSATSHGVPHQAIPCWGNYPKQSFCLFAFILRKKFSVNYCQAPEGSARASQQLNSSFPQKAILWFLRISSHEKSLQRSQPPQVSPCLRKLSAPYRENDLVPGTAK